MPFKRMFWSGTSNQDIHVLRGNATPDLTTERLSVIDNNDTQMDVQSYLGSNNDIRFRFQPLFKGTLSGTVFSGQGISVDITTGVATIDALPRPLPKNNFIIEATATNVAAEIAPGPRENRDWRRNRHCLVRRPNAEVRRVCGADTDYGQTHHPNEQQPFHWSPPRPKKMQVQF